MKPLSSFAGVFADNRDGAAIQAILRGVYDRLSSQIFNTGGLAIGTSSKKAVKVANTIYGIAGGIAFSKTTAEVALAGTVTNAKFNVFAIFVDAAGTLSSAMGIEGAALVNVKFPAIPVKKAVVGYVIINPTGTGNFVGATTDLDDATVAPGAVYVNTLSPFDPTATI